MSNCHYGIKTKPITNEGDQLLPRIIQLVAWTSIPGEEWESILFPTIHMITPQIKEAANWYTTTNPHRLSFFFQFHNTQSWNVDKMIPRPTAENLKTGFFSREMLSRLVSELNVHQLSVPSSFPRPPKTGKPPLRKRRQATQNDLFETLWKRWSA